MASGKIWEENVWGKAVHRVVDRGHQPRAGGRRGDRAHQTDPERSEWAAAVAGPRFFSPQYFRLCAGARGRRPRCVVGEGVLRAGGRGGRARSSPPSSRRSGKQVELVQFGRMRSWAPAVARRSGGGAARLPVQHGDRLAGRPLGVRGPARRPRGVLGPVLDLFDADALEVSTCSTAAPAGAASTLCRWAGFHHVHVWNSLLERAGFTLADIPTEWDRVLVVLVRPGAASGAQGPGPRRHLGRRPADVGRRDPPTPMSSC